MSSIPAYQLDQLGYFVCVTTADESPLEPGKHLLPYGCIEQAPPEEVAGTLRRYVDGAWIYEEIPQPEPEPEPAPEPEPEPLTLEQVKAIKLQAINTLCDEELEVIKYGFPDAEVQSWAKQEAEARAYVADDTAPTPLLSAIAFARGVELAELAAKVIEKADLFAERSGTLIGNRQRCEDEIGAAQTIEEVDAVAWEVSA